MQQRALARAITNPPSLFSSPHTHITGTIEFPKLGSLEEKLEDLRHEGIEIYCAKHGKIPAC